MQLRPMTMDDATMVHKWRNLPRIADLMINNEPIAFETHRRWMDRILTADDCAYWVIEDDSEAVGLANLVDISITDGHCSWGFYIAAESARGPLGVAVEYAILEEVFARRNLHKLECQTLATNERVLALHQHMGFVEEGRIRDHIWRNGSYIDLVRMGMLRSEWEARYSRNARAD